MKKKGFTLIELLAVIVILAVIALIVTPVVTTIISSAKESANARSVEGHIKNVEYAIIANSFKDGMSNPTLYDGKKTESDLNFTYPSNDNIRCESYDIENGMVKVAYKCKDSSWKDTYKYEQGKNAYKDSTGGNVGLVGTPIGEKVLTAFPQLEMGTNGCKVDYPNNYSYMGGCYLRGAQTKNYLWYSGFLWRIMGINQDGTVKLITEENLTSIPYNELNNSNFNGSYVYSWLNDYFYNNIKNASIISSSDFCQGEYTTTESTSRTDCTNGTIISSKLGILTIDEYNLANGQNSYLVNGQDNLMMSPYNNSNTFRTDSNGTITFARVNESIGLRAILNINANALIMSGNGILNNNWNNDVSPYILDENKKNNITGLLKDICSSGEYVKLANKIYRVVSKDSSGNVKMILDGFYEETPNTIYLTTYGTTNIFSQSAGIGQKLNNDVLNFLISNTDTINRNKLVNYNWNQNDFSAIKSYKISINDTNPTRSIEAFVGLIRIGEMMSTQSHTLLTKGYTVPSNYNNVKGIWTLTSELDSNNFESWNIIVNGSSSYYKISDTFGIRPVIVVKSNTTITSGKGLPFSPYEI